MSGWLRERAPSGRARAHALQAAVLVWALVTVGFLTQCSPSSPVVFRVNVGGPEVASTDGGAAWQADSSTSPSQFGSSVTTGSGVLSTSHVVAAGSTAAPAAVFNDARRTSTGAQTWSFPAPAGEYQVNLYFAEIGPGAQAVGRRAFGVWAEAGQVEDRLDVFKVAGGGDRGIVRSHQVTTFDDHVDVSLTRNVGDPMLSAIEVVRINLPGQWSSLPPTPITRGEASFVQLDGRFYLAGGMANKVPLVDQSAYDPATRSWTSLAPLPEPLNHIQAVPFRGRIYYLGGLYQFPGPSSNHVYIYDPATDSFSEGARMPRGRGAGGVAVYGDRIYYAGGLADSSVVNWFDVYDPVADTWQQLPDMPTAKDHFHAAVVGDRFYAISGRRREPGAVVTENVAYDFGQQRWITGLAPSPIGRGGFAAVALGREVLLIGGETRQPNIAYRSAQAYDTVRDTWRTLAPMAMTQHGIEAAACGNDVYVAAGDSAIGNNAPTKVYVAFTLKSSLGTCVGPPPTTTTTTSEPETTTTSTTTTEPETTTTTTTEPETTTTTSTTEPDTTTTTTEPVVPTTTDPGG